MNRLEMPESFAGADIESNQAVSEEIVAPAISAVEIVVRRAGWEESNAAFRVDRNFAPGIRAADILPCVCIFVGVVAELSRMRNGVEGPNQLSSQNIVGAQ